MRIKGVYATSVGEDTPILTRLAQWKIVPKRAVDLAVDFKDASASSRSSVNNCTGGLRSQDSKLPESGGNKDFTALSRKERRQMLARVRADAPVKRHLKLRRTDKIEAACDNVIGQIRDITRETISRAMAVRLISGTETKIDGQWFRSSAGGELFRPKKRINAENLLSRFNRLADKGRAKNVL